MENIEKTIRTKNSGAKQKNYLNLMKAYKTYLPESIAWSPREYLEKTDVTINDEKTETRGRPKKEVTSRLLKDDSEISAKTKEENSKLEAASDPNKAAIDPNKAEVVKRFLSETYISDYMKIQETEDKILQGKIASRKLLEGGLTAPEVRALELIVKTASECEPKGNKRIEILVIPHLMIPTEAKVIEAKDNEHGFF